jgi:MbtH protein
MSYDEDREDLTLYKVVINRDEQYSIWPAHRENAPGWQDVGMQGLKSECLEHIKAVWTDRRPLSLRQRIEATSSVSD